MSCVIYLSTLYLSFSDVDINQLVKCLLSSVSIFFSFPPLFSVDTHWPFNPLHFPLYSRVFLRFSQYSYFLEYILLVAHYLLQASVCSKNPNTGHSKSRSIQKLTFWVSNFRCLLWYLFRDSTLYVQHPVSSQAQITEPLGIPLESCLIFALGYKPSEHVLGLKHETVHRFADSYWVHSQKAKKSWETVF